MKLSLIATAAVVGVSANDNGPSALFAIPGFMGSKMKGYGTFDDKRWPKCEQQRDGEVVWVNVPAIAASLLGRNLCALYRLVPPVVKKRNTYQFSYDKVPNYLEMRPIGMEDFSTDGIVELGAGIDQYKGLIEYFGKQRNATPKISLGASYDWRSPCYDYPHYSLWKKKIEDTVQRTGKKMVMVSHSMGGQYSQWFLNNVVSQDWKEKHIQLYVCITCAISGGGVMNFFFRPLNLYQLVKDLFAIDERDVGRMLKQFPSIYAMSHYNLPRLPRSHLNDPTKFPEGTRWTPSQDDWRPDHGSPHDEIEVSEAILIKYKDSIKDKDWMTVLNYLQLNCKDAARSKTEICRKMEGSLKALHREILQSAKTKPRQPNNLLDFFTDVSTFDEKETAIHRALYLRHQEVSAASMKAVLSDPGVPTLCITSSKEKDTTPGGMVGIFAHTKNQGRRLFDEVPRQAIGDGTLPLSSQAQCFGWVNTLAHAHITDYGTYPDKFNGHTEMPSNGRVISFIGTITQILDYTAIFVKASENSYWTYDLQSKHHNLGNLGSNYPLLREHLRFVSNRIWDIMLKEGPNSISSDRLKAILATPSRAVREEVICKMKRLGYDPLIVPQAFVWDFSKAAIDRILNEPALVCRGFFNTPLSAAEQEEQDEYQTQLMKDHEEHYRKIDEAFQASFNTPRTFTAERDEDVNEEVMSRFTAELEKLQLTVQEAKKRQDMFTQNREFMESADESNKTTAEKEMAWEMRAQGASEEEVNQFISTLGVEDDLVFRV